MMELADMFRIAFELAASVFMVGQIACDRFLEKRLEKVEQEIGNRHKNGHVGPE